MTSVTYSDSTTLAAILGLGLGLLGLICIIAYAIHVLPLWFVFKKAGKEPWKALIPVYNAYVQFEIFWDVKWFWICLAVGFVGGILEMIPIIGALIALGIFAFTIWASIEMAKRTAHSFGQGTAFVVLTFFFNTIMNYVYAFGNYNYKKSE